MSIVTSSMCPKTKLYLFECINAITPNFIYPFDLLSVTSCYSIACITPNLTLIRRYTIFMMVYFQPLLLLSWLEIIDRQYFIVLFISIRLFTLLYLYKRVKKQYHDVR